MFTLQALATDALAAQGDHSESDKMLWGTVTIAVVVLVVGLIRVFTKKR